MTDPILAGTATAIFLIVGYISKMVYPKSAFAQAMLTGGWVFGAVTAAAILVAAGGLLLTILRNTPSLDTWPSSGEVTRAREAWHEALLERGIFPFLQAALGDPAAASGLHCAPSPAPTGRLPHIGFDRPGFSSPDGHSTPGPRPSFTSPDYTSPDFGGREHQAE